MSHTTLHYLLVVAKSVGLYTMALVAFRLMGKRCLGDMEPLDFVVVLAIAEIVGAPLVDPDLSVWPAVVAVVVLTALQLGLSAISIASPRIQTILEGKPILVVKEGRVLRRNLRQARVTPAELAERLRERGFVGPEDVEMAMFETDGMLSAIPRKEASPVTPRFLGLRASTVLLVAGQPVKRGLDKVGLSEEGLAKELARRGLQTGDVEEVLVDPQGRLSITLRLKLQLRRSGSGKQPRGGRKTPKGGRKTEPEE